ncbi:hypothetical protein IT402_00835 [Candidatus Nomurabacteria bacterium]|nr:hypothetical protein [Candidatus Nomurabacteria bacterium]
MKKTIITSFLAIILLGSPVLAAETTPITPDKADSADTTKDTKNDSAEAKKKKIEQDLRSTASKLKSVIERTQVLIELLTKNGKDVSDALDYLSSAKNSFQIATDAIDQFAGIFPETKTDKALTKKETTPVILKDPLKKSEDSLKETKAMLIYSITSLKESITPKETN